MPVTPEARQRPPEEVRPPPPTAAGTAEAEEAQRLRRKRLLDDVPEQIKRKTQTAAADEARRLLRKRLLDDVPEQLKRVRTPAEVAGEGGVYSFFSQGIPEAMTEDQCIELTIPVYTDKDFKDYLADPTAYVATQARKAKIEVGMRRLSEEDRDRMRGAMKKEATSWMTARAVRILSGAGVDPARLLRCRFVLTWKRDAEQPDGRLRALVP